MIERIRVRSNAGPYDVLCGAGVLRRASRELARLGPNTGVFILSSPRVWKLWGREVARSLSPRERSKVVLFDDREAAKNLSTVERICRQLARVGADRRALLVAIGGGVVGDIAGFVAASYLRGVALAHVPTTLLAQVDSSIGGKTGVNLTEGKNLVGAFYSPRLVLTDPGFLRTLLEREYRSGLYEVIKYGAIGDQQLFARLESDMDKLLQRDPHALNWVIARCIRAKARIVGRDERESGLREVLNFGHTLGHALEAATRYRHFLHGEAVGIGMFAASALSEQRGLLPPEDAARIARLVLRVGSLPKLPAVSAARLVAVMRTDKKTRGGKLRFVLARGIGRVVTGQEISATEVSRAWRRLRSDRLLAWAARPA